MSFKDAIRMTGDAEKSPDEVLFLLGLFSGFDLGSALIEALEVVLDKMNEPEDRIWTQKLGFSFLENRSEAAIRNMFRLAFETSLADDAILQTGFSNEPNGLSANTRRWRSRREASFPTC